MSLELLQGAVALGAHPRNKAPALRAHGGQHLERAQASRLLGGDEGVQRQVGKDLAQPKRGQPEEC